MESTPFCISNAPTEILESILNFLHDDRTSLFSASLVCRTWVHTPRHHLFHRTLIMEIFGRGRLMEDNARSFLALAELKDCTILPAIQHIILVITNSKLIDDVIQVLARSPLLVRMVYIHRARVHAISWNAHALPMMREFAFDFPWETLDDDAWSLIRSFSGLHTLSVYSTSLSTVVMPSDVLRSPFSNLRTLRLRLRAPEELFEWLIQKDLNGSHFMLETLDLRIHLSSHNGWGSVSALNSFLAKSANTLKHLSVGVNYSSCSEDNSTNEGTCF
jgi:hypothetical protein